MTGLLGKLRGYVPDSLGSSLSFSGHAGHRHSKRDHDDEPSPAELEELVEETRAALGDSNAAVEQQLLAGDEEGLTPRHIRRRVAWSSKA